MMSAVCGVWDPTTLRYREHTPCGDLSGRMDAVHESWVTPVSPNYGQWLMQWGIFHWANVAKPETGGSYDDTVPPQSWLMFDHTLRFSLSTDFVDFLDLNDPPLYPPLEDRSIQRFFAERVPLCQPMKECR